jgi:ornithine cyclodeaminase/alanine dehydrogenase-like protein (mu-crystallin family)
MGDLRHALAAGAVREEQVHAEMVELVLGSRPGRGSGEEIFVFDSTGIALQDVAAAAILFERAEAAGGHLLVDLAA